jgi:outer membrane protein OmpA-like peptidoglycan-associated protein
VKKICIVFLILIIADQAFAQHSHRAYLTLADSLFKHHNYTEAAYYYQRAIKNANEPGNIMLKIARAYTEINSVKEAEAWYEKAKDNKAQFSAEDTYHYIKELIMLERRKDAEIVLRNFLTDYPEARYAHELLEDIQNTGKYFKDSSDYRVTSLSINTPDAEFAPVYYKGGLVFTSAQSQSISKKKYHWDNSSFLNLYHTTKGNSQVFQKPILFDNEINTRLHDGPVSFYANGERMILNRNSQTKMEGRSGVYISHLMLFDVGRNPGNKTWEFTPLPFEHSSHSFAHPDVSDDGNTLYFISDKPGGYGGTDIYVSVRSNGTWSAPSNLGPDINTPENESFPFFLGNTLYFSSDGHGGLGGLDLFKSSWSQNGFTPPVNLGYPLNSPVDDFSLITKDHRSGYFSSARNGNDDLFEFQRQVKSIKMLARLCDGVTNVSLPEGTIQLLTNTGGDLSLASGKGGNIRFELPEEAAYIMIAKKDGKTGVLSGIATPGQDFQHIVHQIQAYGDTSYVTCIGNLKNESGQPQNVFAANIIDETTGEKTIFTFAKSLMSFQGKQGHHYRIEVQTETGNTAVYTLGIDPGDHETKTWSMTIKDTLLLTTLAVKVVDERTHSSVAGARIRITTLAEPDFELTADENGYAEFSLPVTASYIVIALKDSLAGMHYGFAEKEPDKNTVVHPIYLKKETLPKAQVVALVKNSRGEILQNATVTVTNKANGEAVSSKIENGLLHFFADPDAEYAIRVEHEGYRPVTERIAIAGNTASTSKLSIVLSEIQPAIYPLSAHVYKEKDNSSFVGVDVKILRLSVSDLNLVSNDKGIVEFTVPEGEGYIAVASKDGFTGAYMGIAESAGSSPVIPVPVNNNDINALTIFGKVTNQNGVAIPNTFIEITDNKTGEKILGKIENGVLSFPAKRDGTYSIRASADNYTTVEKTISPDPSGTIVTIPTITLSKRIPVTTMIGNSKGEILKDATVRVTDETTGEQVQAEFKEGVLTFLSEQGKTYDITVEHHDYQSVAEELIVPRLTETVKPFFIALPERGNQSLSLAIAARVFMQSDSASVPGAEVKVISLAADDIDLVSDKDGIVRFIVPEGLAYIAVARKNEYSGVYAGISEKGNDGTLVFQSIVLKNNDGQVPVLGFVMDENGQPPSTIQAVVTDNNTGQPVNVTITHGIVSFDGKKEGDYTIEISDENYETYTESIEINPQTFNIQLLEITLIRKKLMVLPPGASLIIVSNENPRLYITSPDSHDEIIEEKGVLYLQHGEVKKMIGKGSLQALMERPAQLIALTEDQTVKLENIYFDFNSALLDEEDRQVLKKVNEVIVRYPLLKLLVNAHADARGSASYNLGLTRKRARAIRHHLVKNGLRQRHISIRAYGKSVPAVICTTDECSEQQHQRNRRAEFELTSLPKAKLEPLPVIKPQAAGSNPLAGERVKASYADLLAKYGDRQAQELTFKVCVGAYRFNPDMTFPNLAVLGNVTKQVRGGIHYYYLQDFQTLNAAENIRQQAIQKGITDAYVTIFYKGNKISFAQFVSLTK